MPEGSEHDGSATGASSSKKRKAEDTAELDDNAEATTANNEQGARKLAKVGEEGIAKDVNSKNDNGGGDNDVKVAADPEGDGEKEALLPTATSATEETKSTAATGEKELKTMSDETTTTTTTKATISTSNISLSIPSPFTVQIGLTSSPQLSSSVTSSTTPTLAVPSLKSPFTGFGGIKPPLLDSKGGTGGFLAGGFGLPTGGISTLSFAGASSSSSAGFGAFGQGNTTSGASAAAGAGGEGGGGGGGSNGSARSGFGSKEGNNSFSSIWSTPAADVNSIFGKQLGASTGNGIAKWSGLEVWNKGMAGGNGSGGGGGNRSDGWAIVGNASGSSIPKSDGWGVFGGARTIDSKGGSTSGSSSSSSTTTAARKEGMGMAKLSSGNVLGLKGLVDPADITNGEEEEQCVLQIPLAKSYKLVKLKDSDRMEWQELGKGPIKILRATEKASTTTSTVGDNSSAKSASVTGGGKDEEEGKEVDKVEIVVESPDEGIQPGMVSADEAAEEAKMEVGGGGTPTESQPQEDVAAVTTVAAAKDGGESAEAKSVVTKPKTEAESEKDNEKQQQSRKISTRIVMRREGTLAVIINLSLTSTTVASLEGDTSAIRLSALTEDGPTTYLIRIKERSEAHRLHERIRGAIEDTKHAIAATESAA